MSRRTQLKALGGGLAAGLAGCLGNDGSDGGNGGEGGNVEEPIEVMTWNLGFLEESINGWISDYQEEYGYEGKWIDQPADDFTTYFQTRVQSGDPPATLDSQGAVYVQWAKDGVLEPMDDLVDD
ncbi:MAG: hypothetical protein RI560_13470, partial [Natronomonas sp.]|nr:hypothetical protein [Natronomonas sp.]